MLKLRPFAWLMFLLVGSALEAHASPRPKPLTTAETEARNEALVPSLSAQLREARRIARFLTDALSLTEAQRLAVEATTAAERQVLALVATPADAAEARRAYRSAVHGVLDARQLTAYEDLCQRLAGTAQALDGTGLAIR
ncbi:hypothetical protein [Hymenobacter properus]|uniref:Periplasmic heavy metal sensor n=1 Tax=Hymenobacter properus TaxID=2791026 RepID=A0A931BIT9_9BACT|nr:hypothetical protein [Hymenobacter properus]MBF9143072.1 hypothetical protein [Hymenobacter properus]MBR7721880.1 hypothetical protein [Microvirga sp. SRT04]